MAIDDTILYKVIYTVNNIFRLIQYDKPYLFISENIEDILLSYKNELESEKKDLTYIVLLNINDIENNILFQTPVQGIRNRSRGRTSPLLSRGFVLQLILCYTINTNIFNINLYPSTLIRNNIITFYFQTNP